MAAESPESPPLHESLLSDFRPWSDFFSLSSLSIPVSLSDASSRLTSNLAHFRSNYAALALILLLLSLISHPISILVLLATLIAWFFFYFYRSTPIVVLNNTLDDRFVLVVLSIGTIFALVFAAVWWNLFASALASAAVICLHGVFRVASFGDDPYGGMLYSAVDDPSGVYSEF